jgi:MFS family permease
MPATDAAASPRQRNPAAWLRSQALGREYWTFFAVAFFFDAGFAVYFFLFNLFLLDAGMTEQTMGKINGAFTLGGTLALLPAGALAKRWGVKPLLLVCMIFAPLLGAGRLLSLGAELQIGLAFFAGAAMSLWGVCYLPAVARLTTEENRASAYSLIFSASIATSALGGLLTGFLPRWLKHLSATASMFAIHRGIMLGACVIAALATWPAATLSLGSTPAREEQTTHWFAAFRPTRFLLRFLPLFALWTAIPGGFLPFANVYLVREQGLSMQSVGLVYSSAQCLQLLLGLLTPMVLRLLGLMPGILAIQLAAVAAMAGLAIVHRGPAAIAIYLLFSTACWMGSPALYNLLMSRTPDAQRSHTAASALFLNSLLSSITITLSGNSFSRFGYTAPLLWMALAGTVISLAMFRVNQNQ